MQSGKAMVSKYRSQALGKVRGTRDIHKDGQEWQQPLRKHLDARTKEVLYITIMVRVLSGDSEHDIHAKFPPLEGLEAGLVCKVIAEREHLTEAESCIFSLWIISKDLELQIRPNDNLFQLMNVWNKWVMKYTHFPEAQDPTHHVNRHWFVLRREASVPIIVEREICGEFGLNLLLGEALRNYKTCRYICSNGELASIAAYQIQMRYGSYTREKFAPGYLSKHKENIAALGQLIPENKIHSLKAHEWEEMITVQLKQLIDMKPLECRIGLLDMIRKLGVYGASYFPCCAELPPSGFFEFRTQNWYICIGPNGIAIIDMDLSKYVLFLSWQNTSQLKAGTDCLSIQFKKNEKEKSIYLITPQSKIVENLALRIKYEHVKATGALGMKSTSQHQVMSEYEEGQFISAQYPGN